MDHTLLTPTATLVLGISAQWLGRRLPAIPLFQGNAERIDGRHCERSTAIQPAYRISLFRIATSRHAVEDHRPGQPLLHLAREVAEPARG
ncbi:MAG: hypothetical protein HGA75_10600 [Thiobacillus sp.]|nr:hypothetical protein [Thiobacillus sp.]